MSSQANFADFMDKLAWSLPWLVRYPFWRAKERLSRFREVTGPQNLIFVIANHFEPAWNDTRQGLDLSDQIPRLAEWHQQARAIAANIRDCDGTPFRHTNFYPIEQYHRPLLEQLAEMQYEGLGEVEVHLHHGVDQPDDAANLRQTLIYYRDLLAEEHGCFSRWNGSGPPRYAFVHGNWSLGNSAAGQYCGVDSELQILAETGCYADLTLPSVHSRAQVPRFNAIYQCGHPLTEAKPHRSGPNLRVGAKPVLPVLFTGPLAFDWRNRRSGLPKPRIDDGVVTASYPLDLARFDHWRSTRIGVTGRPEWVFIKLYCHGFFSGDLDATIGAKMEHFMTEVLELSARTGDFKVHFATAREAFNLVMAAVDGKRGEPNQYRNYLLQPIMKRESRLPEYVGIPRQRKQA